MHMKLIRCSDQAMETMSPERFEAVSVSSQLFSREQTLLFRADDRPSATDRAGKREGSRFRSGSSRGWVVKVLQNKYTRAGVRNDQLAIDISTAKITPGCRHVTCLASLGRVYWSGHHPRPSASTDGGWRTERFGSRIATEYENRSRITNESSLVGR